MARTLTRSWTLAALLTLPLAWAPPAPAQSPAAPKDEALDDLLKKLEEKDRPPADDPAGAKPPADDKAGPKTRPEEKAKGGETAKGEPSGGDKALDSLLEKLGKTDDTPASDDKPPGGGGGLKPDGPPPEDKPGPGAKSDPSALTGKSKDLDEHLEDLTGKRRKKKKGGDEGGPLSEVIKEMREVEERLGKPDTGEETRKKQTQIVKQIDTLIEQMRTTTVRTKSKSNKPMKPGQQPGPPNDTAGTTGGNAPFAKPQAPKTKKSLASGTGAWGHLPPELRQEMENVFKEEPLASREDLIRRYYLSVSKKTLTRGE